MPTSEIPVVLEQGGWLSRAGDPVAPAAVAIQICYARVGTGPAEKRLAIFFSMAAWPAGVAPSETLRQLAAARRALPVLYSDAGGDDEASLVSADPADIEALAAAAAVMRVSWAWDERAEIPVVINGQRFAYRPRHDGRTWLAAPAE